MAAIKAIQKFHYFTMLAVRMSTYNRPGIRLAHTFLLAPIILPEVLLGEIVGILVETTTLARWFTTKQTLGCIGKIQHMVLYNYNGQKVYK